MSPNRANNNDIPWWWRWLQDTPALVRSLILIVIYTIIAIALEQIAYYFQSSSHVQPWNPAAGWNVVFLLGFGLRYGLAIPLVSIVECVTLRPQETIINGLISGFNIAIFATVGCALLLYKLNFNPRLDRLPDVVKLAVVAFFFSLMYAIVDISTLLALGQIEKSDLLSKIMHQWGGEATGIIMLAPPLLILLRKFPWSDKRIDIQGAAPKINFRLPAFKDAKEWLGLFTITILFTWAAYGGITSQGLDYTYFTFIPLTFVCAWKGFESATVITLLINVMAVSFVGSNVENSDTLALQFGLMTVTYVGLLLSAFVTARAEENSKRQDLEKQLRYDATHDSLTGLYNRAWFLDRLEHTINEASENDDLFAVLFLDLDRFKNVNDSLGHVMGDELLVEIAQQLQECLPEATPLARLGGDEFTIILEELSDTSQANQIAETICQNLGGDYTVNNYQVFITISVGIAFSLNNNSQSASDLLRNADIALYEAKNKGKSQYVVFNSQMYDQINRQTQLEQDLRAAIDELEN